MSDGVLILAGATASGKSDLAVELACRFGAEIVGADSRQIYRNMPVGTAAPTPAQRTAVQHHLIDFLDPHERYSAARFARDAIAAIESIHARGRRAIVAGGTGFYIRALCGGVDLAAEFDSALRDRLAREGRIHPPEFLHGWLALRDPARSESIAQTDTYRTLRALEIALSVQGARTGPLPSLKERGIPFVTCFLDTPLGIVDATIERRTEAMLRDGLLDEAERIGPNAVAASAVGYPQALAYLAGWCTMEELQASLNRATRRYARRQRAWFRGEPAAQWVARDDVAGIAQDKLGWNE